MSIFHDASGAFSESESAKMRRIYLIASNSWPSPDSLTDGTKYRLASIIVYICTSEKQHGCFSNSAERELAAEAVEVLLEMPNRRSYPRAFGLS